MRKITHCASIMTFFLFTAVMISVVATLTTDTINYNSRPPRLEKDLFPQLVKFVTFEKISFDFSGIEFPK